ncbi:hypothetical protein RRG08_001662 [Elysia crispata]|uniref:Uncharacterized protein n=1 Tax=Elysia crispata TaxID=231223 RepID=A0AAE1E089_9GAST|nr:hypothetical protein RRG08_001662 [Elysia crispata]
MSCHNEEKLCTVLSFRAPVSDARPALFFGLSGEEKVINWKPGGSILTAETLLSDGHSSHRPGKRFDQQVRMGTTDYYSFPAGFFINDLMR